MYNQPVTSTYTLRAATISTAATLLTVIGPRGHKGRLVGIGAVVTTSTTGAATLLTAGTAADGDKFGTLSVPVATAGAAAAYNNPTITDIDDNIMAADTAVVIATNGGCTAGAADITVTIDWFE
ncbi:MAG: hypothetical protein Q8L60_10655 [Gammaproteobacteria bacterium]|nr:hypothetical protein [Gammaproteobacteria bacterium]MDP2346808.1 hypothetical protein [Gammaproteobacteria bacterium]